MILSKVRSIIILLDCFFNGRSKALFLASFLLLASQCSLAQNSQIKETVHIRAQNLSRLISDLSKNHPELQIHFGNVFNVIELKNSRKFLNKNLAIINYILLEKQLYIFCGTKDSVFAKIIEIDGKGLRLELLKMYELVRYPGFIPSVGRGSVFANRNTIPNEENALNSISHNLYNILIGNILAEISSKRVLNIIPSIDLRIVPFGALVCKYSEENIRYLRDDFIILNSSKFSLGNSSDSLDFNNLKILGIGNPDGSLPFAEAEVNWIKNRFPKSKVLIGQSATKSNILQSMDSIHILHLASHGYFNYKNYDSSYILIAEDKESPQSKYFNLLKELFYVNGSDDISLLILSACESGITFDEQGTKSFIQNTFKQNTNFGSAGAFLQHGIGAVIATLWQIDDQSTSIFFEDFYNNLEHFTMAESLNRAQLSLKSKPKYKHPYYWAPFTYYGN